MSRRIQQKINQLLWQNGMQNFGSNFKETLTKSNNKFKITYFVATHVHHLVPCLMEIIQKAMGFIIVCYLRRLSLLLFVSCCCLAFVSASDTITATQLLKDPDSLVSNNSVYKLGFFSPNGSTHRYVGIWFNDAYPINVFWVANREDPLNDSSGLVRISKGGNLIVLNGSNDTIWSSNVSISAVNVTAQLSNTGNLVLNDVSSSNGGTLWESFEHPSDSFLPKMKISTNVRTGKKIMLNSWRSPSDPSLGSFSGFVDPDSVTEFYIWNNSVPYWRSGPWNGQVFIGMPTMSSAYYAGNGVVTEDDGTTYVVANNVDGTQYSFVLRSDGKLVRLTQQGKDKDWKTLWSSYETECDAYGNCGAFGSCNPQNQPICNCLKGFEPKNIEEWSNGVWTNGCIRRKPLQCERNSSGVGADGKPDGFLMLNMIKVPANAERSSYSEDDCPTRCLENCTCKAYAYDSGIGCMTWNGDLIDIQKFSRAGSDLYICVAYSELDGKDDTKLIVGIAATVGTVVVAIFSFFIWRCFTKRRAETKLLHNAKEGHLNFIGTHVFGDEIKPTKLQELPLFSFDTLASATNNFHADSKLGQGGFGPVYKGLLPNGKLIAVKRLSRASGQGLEEFMNEVLVISKLQHRNLVRLFGCCTEAEEKMLVYEYLPNKSLDTYLFDPNMQKFLLWEKRFEIIRGIVQGLLYLHRDSRLRIVHRDLKASNILLDDELHPKISDFGMARIFHSNQDQANTARVVGTYGYMSPEYAIHGRFSEKSDIFSFGVLLLEIVCGRKNTSFQYDEDSLSLLGHVWKLWREGNIETVIDPAIFEPNFREEMMRCIQIGLLCVQDYATDRPNTSTVLSMLSSEISVLPSPQQPAFSERLNPTDTTQWSPECFSANTVSLTALQGR